MNLFAMLHGGERLNAVVDYLRQQVDYETGGSISNLKVQKLLYFCQGWALALLSDPLFDSDFRAWRHGPVITDTYHRFKEYGWGAIPPEKVIITNPEKYLKSRELRLIEQVWRNYGGLTAKELEFLTHREKPWIEARQTGEKSPVIPKKSIREHFQTKLDSAANG